MSERPKGTSGDEKLDDQGEGRRGFAVVVAVGSCAIAGGLAIPAAAFVASPLGQAGEKGKRYVVARLDELEVGLPKRVSVVGDEIDAWTRASDRRLGSVWLLRVSD